MSLLGMCGSPPEGTCDFLHSKYPDVPNMSMAKYPTRISIKYFMLFLYFGGTRSGCNFHAVPRNATASASPKRSVVCEWAEGASWVATALFDTLETPMSGHRRDKAYPVGCGLGGAVDGLQGRRDVVAWAKSGPRHKQPFSWILFVSS